MPITKESFNYTAYRENSCEDCIFGKWDYSRKRRNESILDCTFFNEEVSCDGLCDKFKEEN